jgi:nucleoside-diphosphate-sugar epimerase
VPRALVLGGTSVLGLAVARRLLPAGWEVELTGRDPAHLPPALADAGARFVRADRSDADQLRITIGGGAELLVDCLCYTASDARMLLPFLGDVASMVMVSGKAVYVDQSGNHSNSPDAPYFPGPINEAQATLAPRSDVAFDTAEGYGPNKIAAERVLLESGRAVTVLRPSKVHGAGARQAREWYFVKRALDNRPVVLLARRGAGVDQTTAAANFAALVEVVAGAPGQRVLNIADPDAPSGLDISRVVARRLGHAWEEVLLDEGEVFLDEGRGGGEGVAEREAENLGRHPWDRPFPIVLDMTAALALGYQPVGDYASTAAEAIDWLVESATFRDGRFAIPRSEDDFFNAWFDYEAEDRYLAGRSVGD